MCYMTKTEQWVVALFQSPQRPGEAFKASDHSFFLLWCRQRLFESLTHRPNMEGGVGGGGCHPGLGWYTTKQLNVPFTTRSVCSLFTFSASVCVSTC